MAEPMEILLYPDPFLTKRSRPVTAAEFTAGSADGWNIEELVARMKATLAEEKGLGLAATQVGVGLRLFLAHVEAENIGPLAIFNPVVSDVHGTVVEDEGCLSLPGIRAKVKRHAELKLTGADIKGQPLSFDARDLFARVCQHETDHLDGILFINRLGMTGRLLIRRQLAELEDDFKRLQQRKSRKPVVAAVGK